MLLVGHSFINVVCTRGFVTGFQVGGLHRFRISQKIKAQKTAHIKAKGARRGQNKVHDV